MKTATKVKNLFGLSIIFVLSVQLNITQGLGADVYNSAKKRLNTDEQILQIKSLHSDSIQVDAGWNLISLPLIVTDGSKSTLFPSAISDAFIYDGSYQPIGTLEHGIGFWLKFDSSETIHFTGEPFNQDTIDVKSGWNLIGSVSSPVLVDSIKSELTGIISSEFYQYIPSIGYQSADTLQPGIGYWIKVNQNGKFFLKSIVTSCPGIPTVEYGGKIYNTVQVGNQCWLKENLDIGEMIPGFSIQTNNDIIEKYCYDNNTANCSFYGGLYQWDEAMQYGTSPVRPGICPIGWHIPTITEFVELYFFVDGDGNKLKAIGQGIGDGAGTNVTDFSALLSGMRNLDSDYNDLGLNASFWTDSVAYGEDRSFFSLNHNNGQISFNTTDKDKGYSIRCIKGEAEGNAPPYRPSGPTPADSSSDISLNVNLSWICTDPESDPLTYDIYFGTNDPPDTIRSFNQDSTDLYFNNLTLGTTYYWMVVARDVHNNTTIGPVWRFTTTQIPMDGLVAYYPFNGNANDESGNGIDGIPTGAILSTDRFDKSNNAYSFDGIDDYIRVPHNILLQPPSQLTVCAWVYINEFSSSPYNLSVVFKKGGPGAGIGRYEILINPNSFEFNIQYANGTDIRLATSTVTIQKKQWYFLVLIYDGQYQKGYVNGNQEVISNVGLQLGTNSDNLAIGFNIGSGAFPSPMNGIIDDIYIYDRSLQVSEIQALYHLGDW